VSDDNDEDIGKGRPPIATRFKPGQSGNPKGRPQGKRPARPYDAVFDQIVTIRENGEERQVRTDEAFLLHITTKGLAGGGAIARAALNALRNQPKRGLGDGEKPKLMVYCVYAEPGDLKYMLETLHMAILLDPYRPSAHLALETWVVEEALGRLGDRQLTVEEQRIVVAATRKPHKVRWPSWWTVEVE
jgi:hypothetical protein